MEENGLRTERNNCGIRIKKCCASCAFKTFKDIERHCTQTGQVVEGSDYCKQWQMIEALKDLGRRKGVVRDIYTKEIIIK